MTRVPSRRRRLIVIAAILAFVMLAVATTVIVLRWPGPATQLARGGPAHAAAEVTVAHGGTVRLSDGTSVTIPPNAISADATLTIGRGTGAPPMPTGIHGAGVPVQISLSDGARLTGSARVTLPVALTDPPAGWPADAPLEAWPAYFDDSTRTWVAQAGTFDAQRHLITLEVTHFSWWNPFTWDYHAIGDAVHQALADLVGAPSGLPPHCASPPPGAASSGHGSFGGTPSASSTVDGSSGGGPADDGSSDGGSSAGGSDDGRVRVRVEGSSLLDWCLDQDGGQLVLRMRGLRDYPLLIGWSGTANLVRRTEYEADLSSAYRWMASQLHLNPADSVTIPSGGSVDLAVSPDGNAPVYVTATWDPHLQLVGIVDATARVIMALREALGIATTTEKVVQAALNTQCLIQHTDDLASDPAGATVTILTQCVSEVIRELTKDAGQGLLRFFGAVPKVIGALLGVVGYAINQFFVSLGTAGHDLLAGATDAKLTLYVGASPPPAAGGGDGTGDAGGGSSAWPVRDNEGPPAFFAWLGAGFYDFPDFTSCTDDGLWCIGGFGDQVHIFGLKPLRDAGSVPTAAADPKKALLAKGLPAATVDELLRPG